MTRSSNNNQISILSIIILDYNALKYLRDCFASIVKSNLSSKIEVILVDNDSPDNSLEIIRQENYSHPKIKFKYLQNGGNIGFAAGNNRAVKLINPHSKYVLFLNPDTTFEPDTIQGMINYLENHNEIDAATCYVNLVATNKLQPECHRGFPTPWNTFWHFFGLGLPKIFPKSSLLNGYTLNHLDYTKPQQIDCCVGAFLMIKKSVGEKIGWWNEKYFMYGEDLDICYQIKKNGYKLFFVPDYKINHYQGISSGIKKTKSAASRETKVRSAKATTNAMRIFYRENLMSEYPIFLHPIINLGINFLEFYRVFKAKYL